jgi:molybdenum cofactor cytidylyltransferase
MVKITAIILAAGLSRRMGQPKMLLPWGKTTVLGQVVRLLTDSVTDSRRETDSTTNSITGSRRKAGFEVVVIIGGARELVEAEVARLAAEEGLPVRAVFNPQHEAGEMMSSIRVGLAASGPEAEFALIALGDQPQLSPQSARGVVSAANQAGARLVLPSYQMRRGHPWLVHRDLWPALIAAETGRTFLRAHEDEILYVEADETVLKDLDTPEDYQSDLQSR